MSTMAEHITDDALQRYLAKKLSPEEEIAFETAMLDDPVLSEKVILSHTLKSGISEGALSKKSKHPGWYHGVKIATALAAGVVAWLWLPAAFVTSGTNVSPDIVYLEDFRSHVTESVTLTYKEGEAFKVIVSDAPPGFDGTIHAIITAESGDVVDNMALEPNSNNEITLLIHADSVSTGRYQLTLLNKQTEINLFSLEVIKD